MITWLLDVWTLESLLASLLFACTYPWHLADRWMCCNLVEAKFWNYNVSILSSSYNKTQGNLWWEYHWLKLLYCQFYWCMLTTSINIFYAGVQEAFPCSLIWKGILCCTQKLETACCSIVWTLWQCSGTVTVIIIMIFVLCYSVINKILYNEEI
jgi:hypothetical protein